jgi:hypothetical protein
METEGSVAADILNKQWATADKGCSCSLRLGMGLETPRSKNNVLLRTILQGIGLWRFFGRVSLTIIAAGEHY